MKCFVLRWWGQRQTRRLVFLLYSVVFTAEPVRQYNILLFNLSEVSVRPLLASVIISYLLVRDYSSLAVIRTILCKLRSI